ncbi:MAG: hypothetical protein EXR72_08825 [Myxococcales bacterium]|nr:hypothetical protein [Myxococcales bacterium]
MSAADVRAGALFALQLDPQALGAQAADLARRAVVRAPAGRVERVAPAGSRMVWNASTAERRLRLRLRLRERRDPHLRSSTPTRGND